jgi:hypothetical protein
MALLNPDGPRRVRRPPTLATRRTAVPTALDVGTLLCRKRGGLERVGGAKRRFSSSSVNALRDVQKRYMLEVMVVGTGRVAPESRSKYRAIL